MNITTPFSVTLRLATPADAPAIAALFEAHLRSLQAAPDPNLDHDMANFPRAYQAPAGQFVVAQSPEGEIIGMAGLLNDVVRRVHVKEPWRGQRIACQLIAQLLRTAHWPPDRPLRAVVAPANAAARRTFLRCGFVPTGRMPDHPLMTHCELFEQTVPHLLESSPPPWQAIEGVPC